MNSDLSMKINILDDYISKWRNVREGDAVNQLFSETVHFLKNCIQDSFATQKIEGCVEEVGPVYATGNYMSPPIIQVKEGRLEVVCGILQNIKDSIARK